MSPTTPSASNNEPPAPQVQKPKEPSPLEHYIGVLQGKPRGSLSGYKDFAAATIKLSHAMHTRSVAIEAVDQLKTCLQSGPTPCRCPNLRSPHTADQVGSAEAYLKQIELAYAVDLVIFEGMKSWYRERGHPQVAEGMDTLLHTFMTTPNVKDVFKKGSTQPVAQTAATTSANNKQ